MEKSAYGKLYPLGNQVSSLTDEFSSFKFIRHTLGCPSLISWEAEFRVWEIVCKIFWFCFCLGATPRSAQRLHLAVSSGITLGKAGDGK